MTDRNLVDLLLRQARALGPRPALRFKRHGLYYDLPWQRYAAAARAGAAALVRAGVRPGDRVGLLAENSRRCAASWPLTPTWPATACNPFAASSSAAGRPCRSWTPSWSAAAPRW